MHAQNTDRLSPEVLTALRERLPKGKAHLTLEAFIQCALYHPEVGYYRRQTQRVGRQKAADFYTASSLGSLFSRLLLSSIRQLLPEPLENYTWVEAGPESPQGVMGGIENPPFRGQHLIRPGDPFVIPDKAIVFSNELFDAQPFQRFVHKNGKWMELGIALQGDYPSWVEVEPESPLPDLPNSAPEGYTVDWPSQAHALMQSICSQKWNGLFVAFDYGLDRSTIFHERPQGTGRTYANHQMGSDLLANPGQTDITCHLIWDELEGILRASRFKEIQLLRQEAFFMRYGQRAIKDVLEAPTQGFSRDKQTLMELLHPDNMGHKFQVLSAQRSEI